MRSKKRRKKKSLYDCISRSVRSNFISLHIHIFHFSLTDNRVVKRQPQIHVFSLNLKQPPRILSFFSFWKKKRTRSKLSPSPWLEKKSSMTFSSPVKAALSQPLVWIRFLKGSGWLIVLVTRSETDQRKEREPQMALTLSRTSVPF